MDAVEPIEIVVGAIPRQDRAWLQGNPVQRQYVVNLGRGQGHEGGNGTAQIQQRMRFDRRLGRAKVGLREHRQTQIDRSRDKQMHVVSAHDTFERVYLKRLAGRKRLTGLANRLPHLQTHVTLKYLMPTFCNKYKVIL